MGVFCPRWDFFLCLSSAPDLALVIFILIHILLIFPVSIFSTLLTFSSYAYFSIYSIILYHNIISMIYWWSIDDLSMIYQWSIDDLPMIEPCFAMNGHPRARMKLILRQCETPVKIFNSRWFPASNYRLKWSNIAGQGSKIKISKKSIFSNFF